MSRIDYGLVTVTTSRDSLYTFFKLKKKIKKLNFS